MAQKGSLGAYKQVTPRSVDEGAIAENVANTFAAQQTQKREERAKELLRKQKQAQLDAKQAQETFKQMSDLSKFAKDFTTLKPIQGARSVSSLLIEQGKKEYASLMKEYPSSDIGRQIQIQDKLRQMSEWGQQWNAASEALNVKLAEVSAGMGTKYDPVLSAKWATGLARALKSGAEFGAVKRGDNSIDIGKYVTVEDVGTGALSVTFRDDQGNEFVSGSLADITGKIGGEGLVNFVDSNKEFTQNFGKGLAADLQTNSIPYNDMLRISKDTDIAKTKKRLSKLFDAQYGVEIDGKFYPRDAQGKFANKFIEKEVRSGGSYQSAKEKAVQSAALRMQEIASDRLIKDPRYKSIKKEADINEATTAVSAFWRGDQVIGGNLLANTPWNDPILEISNPKLKNYKIVGDVIEVEVTNSKGEVDRVSYDRNDPAQFSTANNLIYSGIAKDVGVSDVDVNEVTSRVLKMDLTPKEDSKFVLGEKDAKSYSQEVIDSVPDESNDFDGVIKSLNPVIELLRSKGLSVDMKKGSGVGSNYKMTVVDDTGKEVAKIDKYWFGSFKDQIPSLVEKSLKHASAKNTNVTTDNNIEAVSIGGTSYNISDLVKNERATNKEKYEGVSDDQIRKAIIDKYGK